MATRPPTLPSRVWTALRCIAADERGTTTENIIWIAGLAALAIAVLAIWGPEILSAVTQVQFTP